MNNDKGYQASRPKEITKSGWKDVFKRVKDSLDEDHIPIVAAGVAFYFFLAIFPALVATISVYGLVTDPAQVEQQIAAISNALPEEASEMIEERLRDITNQSDGALGWGVAISILVGLWSANKGTIFLFKGINIAYNEKNDRSLLKEFGLCMLFTLGGIVLGLISLGIVVAFPAFIDSLGLSGTIQTIISIARWPLLAAILVFALTLIYKYAPVRDNPQFKWVNWGSAIAAILWVGGSLLFTWYTNNFGEYDELYGSLAAVIILMLWFNLTAFVILLGAEINSEMEHQTAKDTTVGEPQPMGERDAYHADRVARKSRKDRESEKKH